MYHQYQDNPLKLLGLGTEPTVAEVKRAYRRMCFECHPDTGRKPPPMEFTVLGDLYERALKVVEERERQKEENAKRAQRLPPTPQPDVAPTDFIMQCQIAPIDDFEMFQFDCAYRDIVVDKRLKYGGTLFVVVFDPIKNAIISEWKIIVAAQDEHTVSTKIRINTTIGPVELTLIFA